MRSLYLCYLPLTEPLVDTQVLAYLRGLADAGHEIHLLTFETKRRSRRARREARAALAAQGIAWHGLRYHKRWSLLATAYDTACGMAVAWLLVKRHHLDVLHARNHVPSAMALPVCRLTGARLLFDVRGLMAEEYADGGIWRAGSVPWRITKAVERAALRRADAVVVLTSRALALLYPDAAPPPGQLVAVIPTSADTDAIASARPRRSELRAALGLDEAHVLVYAGKFSTWYLAGEMARLFAVMRAREPRACFLVLTQSDPALITSELAAVGVPAAAYRVRSVAPAEVGAHLAAADVAISFIAPAPSKAASSPTKIGEYLAAGLPIIVSAGVGDTDELVVANGVGVVVDDHDDASYALALDALEALCRTPELHDRCVEVARRELSLDEVGIPRYQRLYADLEQRLDDTSARRGRY